MAIYYGNNVSTKYSGHTYTWKNLTEYTYTDNGNTFTINIKVKFFLDGLTTTHLRFSKGNFYATLTINGTQEASFSNSPEYEIYGGTENAWQVINFSKTYTKTTSAQTFSVTTTAEGKSPSTWKGVSTVPVGTFTINVPALSTMTATPTSYSGVYDGADHTASIKISIDGATVEYGINTSYGYSFTATSKNTSYYFTRVSACAVADSKTIYYRVSKAGYVTVTGTTTLTVTRANISPSITMANWAYGGTASTPSVSGNSGNGTVTYKYKLKSAADSAYSTTKPSDAGTYTIQATIAQTANYNSKTVTKDFSITFTATPTAYSAQYNAAAHSASIKTSAPNVVVSYGTSTSYGNSVTCTTANTNYTMSSVTRTNTGTTTVYYSASKNGYTVTGTTSIAISDNTSMALTATAYSAQYDGSAHSASIKSNLASTTINYGTSTSYGNSITAGTSNVAMSAVTRTAVGTTTVYYQGTKTYYSSKTGSTTIKITPKFTAQSKSITYNPSSTQNIAITAATGGTGYTYSKVSGSFSISGTNIVVPADTAAGSYSIVVRATDTATSLYTDATYSITIGKATMTITPTAYNAIYNGAAHSASIKSNVASTTISYGTSTSYGNSVTAGTSNVAMSAVTRTNPGTTTVYYKATKTNYNDVTGSTTIKITGVPVHSNVSGTWKHGAVYLNINGTWKPATAGYVNVNGTWKSIDK